MLFKLIDIKKNSPERKFTKLLIILVLVSFIYSTVGFLLTHPLLVIYYKQLGINVTEELNDCESILVFKFNLDDIHLGKIDLRWLDEKEFIFNDNYYDVISKVHNGTELLIHCIADERENVLEEKFKRSLSSNNLEQSQNQKLINFFVPLSEPANAINLNLSIHTLDTYYFAYNSLYLSFISDVSAPPPQIG